MNSWSIRGILALCASVAAVSAMGVPEVASGQARPAGRAMPLYPTPHQARLTGGLLTLSPAAKVVGAETADPEALRLLRECLSAARRANTAGGGGASGTAENAGSIREIVIGERGDAAVKNFDTGIPEKSGAYTLVAAPGRLILVGHDGRGTFYAAQTLRQCLWFDGNPLDLPALEILDWPDVPVRGTVEGFYGTPWTHAARLSQLEFYGRWKMNTYIYGPKDDRYHSSPDWRKPYPPAEAEHIRELVRTARENKVDFVWAIHPGKDIQWTEADFEAVLQKFQAMYELGVHAFAVFFDDISGAGADAAKQADLLNRLQKKFVAPKGDVLPLILCPTEYNKGWANPKPGGYLDILGEKLDPSIRVMWTGNSVVSDIDKTSMAWINPRLRRNALVWWNFPVSDFVRNHLLMGAAYGNALDVGTMLSGFVSNPMERPEASKVALFGVAGYTWNMARYDARQAWEYALRIVMPRVPDAFRTFCAHNSDPGPNSHGYRREESAEIKPVTERFLEGLRTGNVDPQSMAALRAEFARIIAAPAAMRAGAENPRLLEEIGPWLDAFEQLGRAGAGAMSLVAASKPDQAWAAYEKAAEAEARMDEINRTQNQNPYQPGVQTGSLILAPFIKELMAIGEARLRTALTGRPVVVLRPFTNSSIKKNLEKMTDSDESSFYLSDQIQAVGDYFGLDLGGPVPIRKVRLLMGRKSGDHDIVHRGQLESSSDGATWKPLGPETTGECVEWTGAPVPARKIRYRVLHAGKLDGSKNDVWCAIRTFSVNASEEAAAAFSSIEALEKIPVQIQNGVFRLTPLLEVIPFGSGQYVGIRLPTTAPVQKVSVDFSTEGLQRWAVVEVSENGHQWRAIPLESPGSWTPGDATAGVRFIRVRNTGPSARDIKLAKFEVDCGGGGPSGPALWCDEKLSSSAPLNRRQTFPIPQGARQATLLFSSGTGTGVKVSLAMGSDAKPAVGVRGTGDMVQVPLDGQSTLLVIEPAGSPATLHEVLWYGDITQKP